MSDHLQLNVALLRRRVPNLTVAAKTAGLRPATVSNLCTGKVPVGRAEVRTLVTLANLANCTLDELIIQEKGGADMLETGIKVIDLFAPMVKGGAIGFVARPGMGQLVVLGELFYRLKRKGFQTVFLLLDEKPEHIEDVLTEADFYSSNNQEVYSKVIELLKDGNVLLGVDRKKFLTEEFYDMQQELDSNSPNSVTYAIVDTSGEAVDEDLPYGPLESLWKFDMDLAVRSFFPAIDPVTSTSTVLEGLHLEEDHLDLQQKARKILRRYKELRYLVNQFGKERLSDEDALLFSRGERLEAYLTQPFYVAEPFTKKQGESLTIKEILVYVRKIVEGSMLEKEVKDLMYIGKIK